MTAGFDWAKEFRPGPWSPDGKLLERRLEITFASTPLMCEGMTIPARYVLQQVEEAQAAMSAIKGGTSAMIRVVIEVVPFSEILEGGSA